MVIVGVVVSFTGFKQFNINDQILLIRMGQSQSRMLVAAIHWYKPSNGDFEDFMFWRDSSYGLKRRLLDFAHEFFMLSLEPVEAAILNTLVLAATGTDISSALLWAVLMKL